MTSTNQCLRASVLLTGGLLIGAVSIGGCGGEVESSDDLAEGELATRTSDVVNNPLTPVLTCMDELGRNRYRAHFGYTNTSSRSVRVPIGAFNFFVPVPRNQGQPTSFSPGSHPDVFQVTFSTNDGWDRLAWWLNGRRALATRRTPICPPPTPQCSSDADCDDEDSCTTNTCTSGICNASPAPSGTACSHGNICDGSGRCVQCVSAEQCDDERSCTTDQCVDNLCTYDSAPAGIPCGHTGSSCDGAGACQPPACLVSSDCDDEDPCTDDVCSAGACSNPPAALGTACAHGNFCDGAGRCVQCVSASDCDDERSCTTDACTANLCTHGSAPAGTPCGQTGQVCNATGGCITP